MLHPSASERESCSCPACSSSRPHTCFRYPATPSHARRHDAPKRRPICHAVAFSSLFACRNLVFSSILRAILHTTDIDQRPAIACGGRKTRPHRTARPLLIHVTASPPKRPRRQDQQGRLAHNTIFYHVFSRRYSSTPWHFTTPSNPPADRRNFAHIQLRLHPRPNLGCCTSTGAPSSPAGTTPKGRGPRSPRS